MSRSVDRIAGIIAEYDAQGVHRTGTSVDLASAAWMKSRINELGLPSEEDRFSFKRVALGLNRFELGDVSIEGVPMYDGTFTAPEGVAGWLGAIGSDAEIGVAEVNSRGGGAAFDTLNHARQNRTKHRAILLVTDASFPPGGVAILNAEHYTAPLGPPTLQIPNDHWPLIKLALDAGSTGRLVAHNTYEPAQAVNIHCRVPGRDQALAPVVIMTPRSGWWSCASERGGGIAVWFEVLRDLASVAPGRDVIFTANTGHELGHIGLEHFLGARKDLIRSAAIWLHLGANFGASRGGAPRLQYSDLEGKAVFAEAMAAAGIVPAAEAPVGQRPFGESRNVFDGGGRFVSIVGGNDLFHHPDDIFPEAVDLEATAGWARAFVNAARLFADG